MSYAYSSTNRKTASLINATIALVISGIFWFLVANAEVSLGWIALAGALFLDAVSIYFIYFWLNPVTWSVAVSDSTIRWYSPDALETAREIPIASIVNASVKRSDPTAPGSLEIVNIELDSGEIVRVPETCVACRGEQIVKAVMDARAKQRIAAKNPAPPATNV